MIKVISLGKRQTYFLMIIWYALIKLQFDYLLTFFGTNNHKAIKLQVVELSPLGSCLQNYMSCSQSSISVMYSTLFN